MSFLNLNSFHTTLKFNLDHSYHSIILSDELVIKRTQQLETDLHFKKIPRHQYVHTKSCHRHVYIRSIPFGQAVKFKRIISNEDTLTRRLNDFENWIVDKGYESEKMRPATEHIHSVNRDDLLKK